MLASAGMAMMTWGCKEKVYEEKVAQSATPEWISENLSLLVGKELITAVRVKFLEDQSCILHHNLFNNYLI